MAALRPGEGRLWLLREYFLQEESDPGLGSSQILIAEEDLPEAEKLIALSRH